MDFDPHKECQFLSAELMKVNAALFDTRRKLAGQRVRNQFLEQVISEYAKATRRPGRDEWAQVTPRLRFSVFLRDKFKCTYCGASAEHGAALAVDHVTPRAEGGKTILSNLRTACLACNRGKGSTLVALEAMVRVTGPSGEPPASR